MDWLLVVLVVLIAAVIFSSPSGKKSFSDEQVVSSLAGKLTRDPTENAFGVMLRPIQSTWWVDHPSGLQPQYWMAPNQYQVRIS